MWTLQNLATNWWNPRSKNKAFARSQAKCAIAKEMKAFVIQSLFRRALFGASLFGCWQCRTGSERKGDVKIEIRVERVERKTFLIKKMKKCLLIFSFICDFLNISFYFWWVRLLFSRRPFFRCRSRHPATGTATAAAGRNKSKQLREREKYNALNLWFWKLQGKLAEQ